MEREKVGGIRAGGADGARPLRWRENTSGAVSPEGRMGNWGRMRGGDGG